MRVDPAQSDRWGELLGSHVATAMREVHRADARVDRVQRSTIGHAVLRGVHGIVCRVARQIGGNAGQDLRGVRQQSIGAAHRTLRRVRVECPA